MRILLYKLAVSIILFHLFLIHKNIYCGKLTDLLYQYSNKTDLSNTTKFYTSSSVIVFTRQDLDRLKAKTFQELIEWIPLLRFNRDNLGDIEPSYSHLLSESSQLVKLYFNDREVTTPFLGSALRYASKLSLDYIDHIEIYLGTAGCYENVSPAEISIKFYTKHPNREAVNVIGLFNNTQGTKEFYGYSAHELEKFSYLVSLNYKNNKAKKFRYNNLKISKNYNFTDFFAQGNFENSRLEFQFLKLKSDIFLGSFTNLTPKGSSSVKYFYSGWFYNSPDKMTKVGVYATYDKFDYKESGKYAIVMSKFPYFYDYSKFVTKEFMGNFDASHKYLFNKYNIKIGIKLKYNAFKVSPFYAGTTKVDLYKKYDREIIPGMYVNYEYNLSQKNSFMSSIRYDKYIENGGVKDFERIEGRIGYARTATPFKFKFYISYLKNPPIPYDLYINKNESLFKSIKELKETESKIFSTEVLYNKNSFEASFLYVKMLYQHDVYSNGEYFVVDAKDSIRNQYSFTISQNIFASNKIRLNTFFNDGKSSIGFNRRKYFKFFGGYIALLGGSDKFEHSEVFIYRNGDYTNEPGYVFNCSFSYFLNKSLTIFFKGENIFDKALTTDYYKVSNVLTHSVEKIKNVKVYDRKIWVGFEWQF